MGSMQGVSMKEMTSGCGKKNQWQVSSLTNTDGSCGQEDEPEDDEVSCELEGEEHDGREDQGVDKGDADLLHHLEYDVCYRPIQTIIPLPAPATPTTSENTPSQCSAQT